MYEQEQEAARLDFVQRFVWNGEDCVLLRMPEGVTGMCVFCKESTPATNRMHDYEDDASGGYAVCEEHSSEVVFESGRLPAWVTQDPEGAWNGILEAEGHGWSGLWFLFAAPGAYSKGGVWPYEGDEE